jgi:hypothetical protein
MNLTSQCTGSLCFVHNLLRGLPERFRQLGVRGGGVQVEGLFGAVREVSAGLVDDVRAQRAVEGRRRAYRGNRYNKVYIKKSELLARLVPVTPTEPKR